MRRVTILLFLTGFVITLALLVAISVLGYQENAALARNASVVSTTHQVLERLASLSGAVHVLDTGMQLMPVTFPPDALTAMRQAVATIAPAIADLRTLTADSPGQQARLDQLDPLLHARVAAMNAALGGGATALRAQATAVEIENLIRAMEEEERQMLPGRTAQTTISLRRAAQLIISGSLLGLLIGTETMGVALLALRARNHALHGLSVINAQLDDRVQQQTAALSAANDQLTALSHQLLTRQEVERFTIATALRESISQDIAALQLNLQILDDMASDQAVRTQLSHSMVAIDHVLDQLRALSLDLRPSALDDFGLIEAIRTSVDLIVATSGMAITLEAATLGTRPSAAVEGAAFRIAHDAATMFARTPGVGAIRIQVAEQAGMIALRIGGDCADGIDNPTIPDVTSSALELLTIRERAAAAGGTITVGTTARGGVMITASFPHAAAS
ncbi:MAG: CHASE3 domain-containing protein [Chloroflexales bacterium]